MAVGKKTGGRSKGTPNKLSGQAKENIVAVFNRLGGTAAMAEWAMENQTQFYQIYAKLLPLEVTGENGGPMSMTVTWNQ
jgi:hypothetical protein